MIKNDNEIDEISSSIISHCAHNKSTSFILFTSPETLLKPQWLEFIYQIIDKKLFNLLCLDEIHLFVDFGYTFRSSFFQLKSKLFQHLKINDDTSIVPILLMTATFNIHLLKLLEGMIGFCINQSNMFWATIDKFNKRHIKIELNDSMQPYSLMKSILEIRLKNNSTHKAIVITNTAKMATQCHNTVETWLDNYNKMMNTGLNLITLIQ